MTTFVLVHGYWHGGDSWDAVARPLREAGHTVLAPSLATAPGTTLADHLDTLRELGDAAGDPVVLVGSSAAAKHVLALSGDRAADVALAVYVDTLPQPLGASGEPAGESIPFSWDELTPEEQRDLTDEQRAWIERTAVPYPARVARDGWELDPRAYDVPALVIGTGFDEATLQEWRSQWPAALGVVDHIADQRWRWLPTSHWPHQTRPEEMARILCAEASSS